MCGKSTVPDACHDNKYMLNIRLWTDRQYQVVVVVVVL